MTRSKMYYAPTRWKRLRLWLYRLLTTAKARRIGYLRSQAAVECARARYEMHFAYDERNGESHK